MAKSTATIAREFYDTQSQDWKNELRTEFAYLESIRGLPHTVRQIFNKNWSPADLQERDAVRDAAIAANTLITERNMLETEIDELIAAYDRYNMPLPGRLNLLRSPAAIYSTADFLSQRRELLNSAQRNLREFERALAALVSANVANGPAEDPSGDFEDEDEISDEELDRMEAEAELSRAKWNLLNDLRSHRTAFRRVIDGVDTGSIRLSEAHRRVFAIDSADEITNLEEVRSRLSKAVAVCSRLNARLTRNERLEERRRKLFLLDHDFGHKIQMRLMKPHQVDATEDEANEMANFLNGVQVIYLANDQSNASIANGDDTAINGLILQEV